MNRIKEILEQRGIKQSWLARQISKDVKTINNYVNNRYQPSLITLTTIAKVLNLDVKDLLN